MRASPFAALVATAGLPALAALAAITPGSPVPPGNTFVGAIGSGGDTDAFRIPLVDGSRFSAVVKASKGSGLQPYFDLYRPDGVKVDLSTAIEGEGSGTVSVSGLPVNATGEWKVVVSGQFGSSGGYSGKFSETLDKKAKGLPAVPAGGTFVQGFPARSGAAVTFSATVKSGPPLASAVVVDPSGAAIPGAVYTAKGAKVTGKKILLSGGDGLFGIRLTGDTTGPATVSLKVKIKQVKIPRGKVVLGEEPRPTGLSPDTGRDGAPVAISGTGFQDGAGVLFAGNLEATGVTVESPTRLTCLAPAGSASDAGAQVVVTVVNPDGQEGSLTKKFRYLSIPAATSLSPGLSPLEGGATVTIVGSGFRAGYSVEVDGIPATSVQTVNASTLTCVTPPHAAGPVTAVVFDEFGRPGAPVGGLTYADTPSVLSANPDTVPSFGGQTVTVTGSDFANGDRVFVNGVTATQVTVIDFDTLTFTMPAGDAGPVDVTVEDELGRSGTLAGALVRTRSFQVAAGAIPAAPNGTDFYAATVAAADLDDDGRQDLLVATGAPKTNTATGQPAPASWLLFNDGTGTFSNLTATRHASFNQWGDKGQASVALVGDLDADGNAEVVLARRTPLEARYVQFSFNGYPAFYSNDYPNTFDTPTYTATRILENDGAGKLSDNTVLGVPSSGSTPWYGTGERWQAAAAALGDLDGDDRADVVLVADARVDKGTVTQLSYTYIKKQYYYYYYYYYKDKAILEQSGAQTAALRVLLNKGNGTFKTAPTAVPAMVTGSGGVVLDDFRGAAVAVGDLDGDGDRDVVVVQPTPAQGLVSGSPATVSAVRVFRNQGTGTLSLVNAAMPTPYASAFPASNDFWQGNALALGDLDGDGAPELVVGRSAVSYWTDTGGVKKLLPAIRIFSNDGSGAFTEATSTFLPDPLFRTGSAATILGVKAVEILDLDGDGDRDLLLSGQEFKVTDSGGGFGGQGLLPAGSRPATRVLLNDGTGSLSDGTADWVPTAAGNEFWQADAVKLVDVDGDGSPDLVLVSDTKPGGTARPVRVLKNR